MHVHAQQREDEGQDFGLDVNCESCVIVVKATAGRTPSHQPLVLTKQNDLLSLRQYQIFGGV